MNDIINDANKLCKEFVIKSKMQSLTEYEVLCYERICRMLESYYQLQYELFYQALIDTHEEMIKETENDNDFDTDKSKVS